MAEGEEGIGHITLELLKGEDAWKVYRDISIAAQEEFPDAFGPEPRSEGPGYWKFRATGIDPDTGQKDGYRWNIVAKKGDKYVGMISAYRALSENQGVASIGSLHVSKEAQATGLGTRLFASLMKELRKNESVRVVELIVSKSNEHAIQLYKRFGFKVRRIAGLLQDPNHEELVMSRMIRK